MDLTKLITTKVIPPVQVPIVSRSITIYVPIYSAWESSQIVGGGGFFQNGHLFGAVFKNGTTGYTWGNTISGANAYNYAQYFPNAKQSGFPGYLLGSQSLCISTQVYIDGSGKYYPEVPVRLRIYIQQVQQCLGYVRFQKMGLILMLITGLQNRN